MKQCPRCSKTYTDESLNFCLEDGELLTILPMESPRFDDPPTMIIDQARVTNPVSWPHSSQPPAQPPMQWQQPSVQPQMFGGYAMARSQNQTLPTISLILGIFSLPMCWCGWLGLPAAILGFIGMRNADNDPAQYGGRGMAIAGMIMGAVSLLVFFIFLLVAVVSG